MSIDLAKRAYLAAWKDAVTHPTRDMSPELAFEYWWQRELAMLEPLPVPLLDKETLQPVKPFDFSKLPRPGDANYRQSQGRGMRVVPPITVVEHKHELVRQRSIMGDNDGPYERAMTEVNDHQVQGIVGDDGRFVVNAEVTANFITGETTYRDILPGERVGDVAGVEGLFDEARAFGLIDEANREIIHPDQTSPMTVERERFENPLLDWAVSKWNSEVKNRPLINVHRRSLDDTWRQVIRWAGGDPVTLVGPAHDDLLRGAGK